jgi:hypothetical protein
MPKYKSLDILMKVSDIHLEIFKYDRATMLAAIKPQLFLFNIQLDYLQGLPNTERKHMKINML